VTFEQVLEGEEELASCRSPGRASRNLVKDDTLDTRLELGQVIEHLRCHIMTIIHILTTPCPQIFVTSLGLIPKPSAHIPRAHSTATL
jgi:hypothetical protein